MMIYLWFSKSMFWFAANHPRFYHTWEDCRLSLEGVCTSLGRTVEPLPYVCSPSFLCMQDSIYTSWTLNSSRVCGALHNRCVCICLECTCAWLYGCCAPCKRVDAYQQQTVWCADALHNRCTVIIHAVVLYMCLIYTWLVCVLTNFGQEQVYIYICIYIYICLLSVFCAHCKHRGLF